MPVVKGFILIDGFGPKMEIGFSPFGSCFGLLVLYWLKSSSLSLKEDSASFIRIPFGKKSLTVKSKRLNLPF